MANGSFSGTSSNSSVRVRVVWSAVSDPANNSSAVTASLQLYKNSAYSYRTYGTGSWSITINGSRTSRTLAVSLYDGAGWVTAVSATVTVPHNADGTKSISISASGGISGTSLSSVSASRTVVLDSIPRKSTLTLGAASVEAGGTVQLSVAAADASFTHRAVFSIGSCSDALELGDDLSAEYTLPMSFCSALPAQTQGTITYTLETYADGDLIGSDAKTLTMTVPASVIPTLGSVSAAVADGIDGLFVQDRSRAVLTFHGAAGAYGSSITAYIISGLATGTAAEITTPVLSAAGDRTFSCRVVDSRGRESAAVSVTIHVEAYEPPHLSCHVQRVLANGTPDPDGTRLSVSVVFSCSTLSGHNSASCAVAWREHGTTPWTDAGTVTSGTPQTLSGSFDSAKTWEVRFLCTDTAGGRTEYVAIVPQSFRLMNVSGPLEGIAFGKLAARRGVEVALPAFFSDTVSVGGELLTDFITEEEADDSWVSIRLNSGLVILFYTQRGMSLTLSAASGVPITAALPFALSGIVLPWAYSAQKAVWGGAGTIDGQNLSFCVLSLADGTVTADYGAMIVGFPAQT